MLTRTRDRKEVEGGRMLSFHLSSYCFDIDHGDV